MGSKSLVGFGSFVSGLNVCYYTSSYIISSYLYAGATSTVHKVLFREGSGFMLDKLYSCFKVDYVLLRSPLNFMERIKFIIHETYVTVV